MSEESGFSDPLAFFFCLPTWKAIAGRPVSDKSQRHRSPAAVNVPNIHLDVVVKQSAVTTDDTSYSEASEAWYHFLLDFFICLSIYL